MTKKLIYSMISACGLYGSAEAAISVSFEAGVLNKRDGSMLDVGSYVAVFAQLNTGGALPLASDLLNQTLIEDSTYGGSRLIALGQTDVDGYFFKFRNYTGSDPYTSVDLAAGNELSFYWFDSTSADLTPTAGNDIDFGTFRSDTIDVPSGAIQNSTLPANGSTVTIAHDTDFSVIATPALFRANAGTLSMVPEPTSVSFFALSSVMFLLRRKRIA